MDREEICEELARLVLEGEIIDEAVSGGRFEAEEIPVVYEILDRGPRNQITFDGNKPDYKWNTMGGD